MVFDPPTIKQPASKPCVPHRPGRSVTSRGEAKKFAPETYETSEAASLAAFDCFDALTHKP
jgi:hypothetical protein